MGVSGVRACPAGVGAHVVSEVKVAEQGDGGEPLGGGKAVRVVRGRPMPPKADFDVVVAAQRAVLEKVAELRELARTRGGEADDGAGAAALVQ